MLESARVGFGQGFAGALGLGAQPSGFLARSSGAMQLRPSNTPFASLPGPYGGETVDDVLARARTINEFAREGRLVLVMETVLIVVFS